MCNRFEVSQRGGYRESAIIAAIVILYALMLSGCPKKPAIVAKPVLPSCDTKAFQQPIAGAVPIAFPSMITGGTYVGKSAHITTPIKLDELDRHLLIIVNDELRVSADILFPYMLNSKILPLKITLVSLQGTVRIDPNIKVGFGSSARGINGNRNFISGDGAAGGEIKIIGVNIENMGTIHGNNGGVGGKMIVGGGFLGITTKSSDGGRGGNVILCAMESITVGPSPGAKIAGGIGGNGGELHITTIGDSDGKAGNGKNGGDLYLIGTGSSPVMINNFGEINGGNGGHGEIAIVDVRGVFTTDGASAVSKGGYGGKGGTVLFSNSVSIVNNSKYTAGSGGIGGSSYATANDGPSSRAGTLKPLVFSSPSDEGGDAHSTGGMGGQSGDTINIPETFPPFTRLGIAGHPGSGGSTQSLAGAGGNGGTPILKFFIASGSQSGKATATGGKNGDNKGGKSTIKGPMPPVGVTGGRSVTAYEAGTP